MSKALMANANDGSEVAVLVKITESEVGQVKANVKAMRRRMPQQEQLADGSFAAKEFSITYPASEGARTAEAIREVAHLVRIFYVFGRTLTQQAGLLPDPDAGLAAVKTGELLHTAIDKVNLKGIAIK